jgi:UPF0755 protein
MIAKKITRTLTVVVVLFLLIVITAAGFYFGFSYVIAQNARFVSLQTRFSSKDGAITKDTPGAIELVLPRGIDTQEIAELLKDKGIIEDTFVFTILSKFNGFDGSYMAGTHFITKNMNYDEIMYVLSLKPHTVRVSFPEGLTYKEVKKKLKDAGVVFDEKVLDDMVHNPQRFLDYNFVTEIAEKEGRDWLLQGYLYPDTYEFDMNTDEESIIRTFLNNTESKLTDEYYERLDKLDPKLTMDQVIIMASIIQNECSKVEEMRTVSGVFYNRLRKSVDEYMPLQSCATINYLRKELGLSIELWLSQDMINQFVDNPYNTYNIEGLPPGPICSPGEDAIRAALWPKKTPFYYFCAMGNGFNWFTKTLSDHEKMTAKFQAHPAKADEPGNYDT